MKMYNMKNKKTFFLSLGVFATVTTPIFAAISCGGSNKIKNSKDFLQNISLTEIAEKGGIFGPNAKNNDYALMKKFSFSLTNKKGSIYKIFKLLNPKIRNLTKIKSEDLYKLLRAFYDKGVKGLNDSDLDLLKNVISIFEEDVSKISQMESLINVLKGMIDENNFKTYIVNEEGLFNVVKRFFSNSIISLFDSMFEKVEDGFLSNNEKSLNYTSLNYKNKILDFIKEKFNSIIHDPKTNNNTNNILDNILGLNEETGDLNTMHTENTRTLFKTLQDELFSKYSVWSNDRLNQIENDKSSILKNTKKPLVKKYLFKLIERTKKVEKEKEIEASKTKAFVPFKKGILNAQKEQQRDNVLFLQSTIQRFLLYFSSSENIQKTIDDMKSKVSSVEEKSNPIFQTIKIQIENAVSDALLWKIASSDLTKYNNIFWNIINNNIDELGSLEINGILDFLFYLDHSFALDTNDYSTFSQLHFTNSEIETSIDVLLNGFKNVDSKKYIILNKLVDKTIDLFFPIEKEDGKPSPWVALSKSLFI